MFLYNKTDVVIWNERITKFPESPLFTTLSERGLVLKVLKCSFKINFKTLGDRKQVENGLSARRPDTVSRNVSTKTRNDLQPPRTTYNHLKPPTAS